MKSVKELPMATNVGRQVTDTRPCSTLRVKASCGHIAEPQSLKAWAKSRIDTGIHSFPCQTCKKEWVWQEVCKLALFTEEERDCYEKKLVELTKDDTASYKKCPDCNYLVQRVDPDNLCVECLSCSNVKGKLYQFCWDCMREWNNPASQNNDCGNKSCSITAMLLSCPLIEAPNIEVHQCPVVRACPNCETLVSHCQQGCPQVMCPNCFYEFCYRCLGIEGCKFAEFVELTDDDEEDDDDDDSVYEDLNDFSECIRAGRQKITGRKNYKINPNYKLDSELTDSEVEGDFNYRFS